MLEGLLYLVFLLLLLLLVLFLILLFIFLFLFLLCVSRLPTRQARLRQDASGKKPSGLRRGDSLRQGLEG